MNSKDYIFKVDAHSYDECTILGIKVKNDIRDQLIEKGIIYKSINEQTLFDPMNFTCEIKIKVIYE